MSKQIRAAVFASGTGSNFQAMMESEDLGCDIVCLICDQPGAKVIDKAKGYGVPVFVIDPKTFPSKEAYESHIKDQLMAAHISWVFLAGYMRMVGPTLLEPFEGRILNIHPSLLPEFPGMDAIGQALEAQVNETGVTVHYIDAGMDTGPVVAQEKVAVEPTDTIETLQKRIQRVEHTLYPSVIKQVVQQDTADC